MHSVQDVLGDSVHAVEINQSLRTSGCSWVINGTYTLGTMSVILRFVAVSYNYSYYT